MINMTQKSQIFFGLSIAYDPYKMEVIDNKSFSKGGDGGCNICGGFGEFLGYLSCSPYYTQKPVGAINIVDDSIVNEYDDELDGDFNFLSQNYKNRRVK